MIFSEDTIEKYWPLSQVKIGAELQHFDGRKTIQVQAQGKSYVCKIFNNDYSKDNLFQRIQIFDFLKERNFTHIPHLLKTGNGEDIQEIDGYFIFIMEHIPGVKPNKSPENYSILGNIMGHLNNIQDYPNPALISVNAIRPDFIELSKCLPEEIRAEYLTVANNLPDIDSLPKGLIHFEAGLGNNTLQKPEGEIVIIDWDEAGHGAAMLDPGYLLISELVSEDLVFNETGAKAFFRAYTEQRSLSKTEKEMLFQAGLFHALRYIVWGDHLSRWQRIKWAIENQRRLEQVF